MIDFKVVTPLGEHLHKDVKSISVKTVEGQMVLLPHHMPIVAALVPCRLALKDGHDKMEDYAISGGFLHFDNDKCLLLSDAIEGAGEINLERAKEAYKRARNRIDKKDSTTNMRRAELSLKRAINRINVAASK